MDAADVEKLEAMLRELWEGNRAALLQRVHLIRDAQREMAEGGLKTSTRKQAREAAHKLAGVLGTFGLPRGSELARHAEILLDGNGRLSAAEAAPLAAIVDELDAMIAAKSAKEA